MKLIHSVFGIVAGFAAVNASATTLYLDSVDGVKDSSGNYVAPYNGRVDATAYLIFCDDFDHNINIGASETVNVSTLMDLSKTRFGGLTGAVGLYEQVFYLSSFLVSASNTDRGDIQDAMWSYFASDAPNQSSLAVKGWEKKAADNYLGKDYSTFKIFTEASNQFGGKQELFVMAGGTPPAGLNSVPEPGTWAMLLTGAGGFALLRFRRKHS